jgi:hypothetical protein
VEVSLRGTTLNLREKATATHYHWVHQGAGFEPVSCKYFLLVLGMIARCIRQLYTPGHTLHIDATTRTVLSNTYSNVFPDAETTQILGAVLGQ